MFALGAALDVTTLLGNYAFPMVACIVMAYYVKEIQKQHSDEVSKLREVLERNTIVLEKLSTKIGGND